MKVREAMTPNPVCCVPTDTAQKAAQVLCDNHIGSVPVVADQQSRQLVGIMTVRGKIRPRLQFIVPQGLTTIGAENDLNLIW